MMDTLQHEWVQYTITPVEIEVKPDGTPEIKIDLDAPVGSAYGCKRCSLPLAEGINKLCEPEPEEESTP